MVTSQHQVDIAALTQMRCNWLVKEKILEAPTTAASFSGEAPTTAASCSGEAPTTAASCSGEVPAKADTLGETPELVYVFGLEHGPFRHYRRTVTINQRDKRQEGRDDHPAAERATATQNIEFAIATPIFAPFLTPLIRWYLKRSNTRPLGKKAPWWAPPQRLDAEGANTIATLAIATLLAAYLGTLLSQTITFVAEDFAASRSAQGNATAVTRLGAVLALIVVAAADRWGRRRALLISGFIATITAAGTAAASGMITFAILQMLSRGFATGFALLIGIASAEEAPEGSRAWTTSVLALFAGLGSGIVLWLVPFIASGEGRWRGAFLAALLWLPLLYLIAKHLNETRRFTHFKTRQQTKATPISSTMVKRFAMLAVVGFATALFAAPSSNFQNEYLRIERDFSGSAISMFSTVVNVPIAVGVAIFGPLADRKGRRIIGWLGIIGGVGFTVIRYSSDGPIMWASALVATIIGAASIPALGVYGPELFPTSRRGLANGLLTIVSVIGSMLGLWFIGRATENMSFGRAFGLLAIIPIMAGFLVLAYPETAKQKLEDLNPSDR